VEVSFEDAGLAKTCGSAREMARKHGPVRAKKLAVRLSALRAASTLASLRGVPGRCHELTGDLAGFLSLDLDGPYRLLFRPAGAPPLGQGGGLDWSAVDAVTVVGIADTHH
jgi:proteic killer suppression protein